MSIDVLIVGRGGGSIEELWAFNEEMSLRNCASRIPIISAVGHETDFTIADFVADLRAATPTAAAEQAVPSVSRITRTSSIEKEPIGSGLLQLLREKRKELSHLQESYAFRYPKQLLVQKEQELDEQIQTSATKICERLYRTSKRNNFTFKSAHLDALSPLKIMSKGYSLVYNQERTNYIIQ